MTQQAFNFIFNNSLISPSSLLLTTNTCHWKILLVEDVEILAKAASFLLQKMACKIDWTKTAQDAQILLSQRTYDLMLLDLGLSDMNGLELAKLIRSHSRWNSIPIIVLTAQRDETCLSSAQQIGLNGFLHKPITQAMCQNLLSWLVSEKSEREFFTG